MSKVSFSSAYRCILQWGGEVAGEVRMKQRPQERQVIVAGDYMFQVLGVSQMSEGQPTDLDVYVAMRSND